MLKRFISQVIGRRKIDFVVAGTQKGGTSALDAYLREHPQICMPMTAKELHFFDHDRNFLGDKIPYGRYHRAFHPRSEHKVLGEVTPSYMYWPEAAQRIQQYNLQMKIILLLRNPIDRAYSHWAMAVSNQQEVLDFSEAIRNEERRRQRTPLESQHFSYVDRGFYTRQVNRLMEYFPREQLFFSRSEDLQSDPLDTLNGIFRFLQVDDLAKLQPKQVHVSKYDTPMREDDRAYLRDLFAEEIHALHRLTAIDCLHWLEPPTAAKPEAERRNLLL